MKELILQAKEVLVKHLTVSEVSNKLFIDITYLGREIAFLGKILGTNGCTQAEGG